MRINPSITEPERISDPILEIGKTHFGIQYLFPYQRLALYNILASCGYFGGEEEDQSVGDQIILLPTGAGKSLCFQIPAMLIPGLTVVVYPLLALMADQFRRLQEAKVPTAVLKGGQTREERTDLFQKLKSGRIKILLTNPESLSIPGTVQRLTDSQITHFVVDEAHCIVQWGETFRPSYLLLGEIREKLQPVVTTAFTATASPSVLQKIQEHLFSDSQPHIVAADPDRPNIQYSVLETLSKMQSLITLLEKQVVERPVIVFTRSRKGAELLSLSLRRRLGEREIFFYHAGLSREEKKEIEEWFFQSKGGILTSTNAYGMGVDKANIHTVIHYEAPPSVEAYLQESGRAGRDKLPAQAILLVSELDKHALDPFFRKYIDTEGCRRAFLYSALGAELESCSGCDRCNGIQNKKPEGYKELEQFFRHNSRRYTQEEAVRLLSGIRTYFTRSHLLEKNRWFGLLHTWDPEDLKEALDNLREKGLLKEGKWLWKRMLSWRSR
ncbi:MAG: ATP-dependent DNA helicase RecQ [Spirochaetales bacterium]|nr:ATP-dependent DNA helicase RecQ [Spirochaetales bacterium]